MVKKLLFSYLEYLEIEKNKSPSTIKNYTHYLFRFLDWAKISNPQEITPLLVRKYKLFLNRYKSKNGENLKKVTINHHLIALRNFLRFLARIEELEVMPADRVELLQEEGKIIRVLNEEQLNNLLKAPNVKTKFGIRDKAILELLFSSGMRVSELVSLNCDNLNFKTGEISVIGKGKKVRVVFISKQAEWALKAYLARRKDDFRPLFIRYRGPKAKDPKGEDLRLSTRSVEKIVKACARKIGLAIEPTPHTLRHTFATDLLRSGADLRSVQELLGHKNVATTQIYTHVTNLRLKEVHKKYHRGNR